MENWDISCSSPFIFFKMHIETYLLYSKVGGGRGQGGLNLPLPVLFNPGSRPVFFGSCPFAFFRLQNIVQCCIIFFFFSRFLPPWESRFPPPLLQLPAPSSPASRTPPTPFSPGLSPPCPPPTVNVSLEKS